MNAHREGERKGGGKGKDKDMEQDKGKDKDMEQDKDKGKDKDMEQDKDKGKETMTRARNRTRKRARAGHLCSAPICDVFFGRRIERSPPFCPAQHVLRTSRKEA